MESLYTHDWNGVAMDTKELSIADISQMRWGEIKSEVITTR